jgi:hypothetical protein
MMSTTARSLTDMTREHVLLYARSFVYPHPLPSWTMIVEGREFPVMPLVRGVLDVTPLDCPNSHQSVRALKKLGFEIHYKGQPA